MAFNGSGTYSAPASSWNPAVDGTDINSTDWAALLADLSTALSLCVTKDGQQTATATVPFAQGITAPTSALGNVHSGTYTPTLTAVSNVTGSTAATCQYIRVGNVVTVSGGFAMQPTVDNTDTVIGVSLPVSSNLASISQLGGVANSLVDTEAFAIFADTVNDRANVEGICRDTTSHSFYFTFTYRVI